MTRVSVPPTMQEGLNRWGRRLAEADGQAVDGTRPVELYEEWADAVWYSTLTGGEDADYRIEVRVPIVPYQPPRPSWLRIGTMPTISWWSHWIPGGDHPISTVLREVQA